MEGKLITTTGNMSDGLKIDTYQGAYTNIEVDHTTAPNDLGGVYMICDSAHGNTSDYFDHLPTKSEQAQFLSDFNLR